jgi:hypothetical protein
MASEDWPLAGGKAHRLLHRIDVYGSSSPEHIHRGGAQVPDGIIVDVVVLLHALKPRFVRLLFQGPHKQECRASHEQCGAHL